jgi:hypothetical protein
MAPRRQRQVRLSTETGSSLKVYALMDALRGLRVRHSPGASLFVFPTILTGRSARARMERWKWPTRAIDVNPLESVLTSLEMCNWEKTVRASDRQSACFCKTTIGYERFARGCGR